jgi:anti-sigma regulatory factor (Ser/Thr protein kinase)
MKRSSRGVSFPVTAAAPRRARTWAHGILHVDERRRDIVLLLLSELVTNSVRHSGASPHDQVEIGLREHDHTVHVEVRDPGAGMGIALGDIPAHSGLQIVDALSARWGVRHDPTTVWFDVSV